MLMGFPCNCAFANILFKKKTALCLSYAHNSAHIYYTHMFGMRHNTDGLNGLDPQTQSTYGKDHLVIFTLRKHTQDLSWICVSVYS